MLSQFLAGRPGAAQRAGVKALRENSVASNLSLDDLTKLLGSYGMSKAGVPVTEETAMRVSAVYACVDRIVGAIATLPLGIYERAGEARKPVEHDYHWMLNERANEDMSAADAWSQLVANKLFGGDGYAELLRPSMSSARVIGWKPHHWSRVTPFRDHKSKRKYFRVLPDTGGPAYVLDQADMVQLTSLGYDGLTSPSPITYAAREAIGTALAQQDFAGRFFSEGAVFDYALQTDQGMNGEQVKDLREQLLSRVSGSRAPLILAGGLKPAQLTINPKDAEILGTRLFSVEEICRIFGVPPYLVGHTEKNSSWGTGMESQGANFKRYTLLKHLVQIAQELNHKLWPTRQRYFVQHVTAELERGDFKSRMEGYRTALGRAGERPIMTTNEVRRAENLPPAPGGDSLEPLAAAGNATGDSKTNDGPTADDDTTNPGEQNAKPSAE
ncbi:phage portal protein [Roseateles sp.]|uniref:phage portal protein n=1 Tax=Roseateles sp. TaxID=1971397 RepID=UPI002F3E6119